MSASGEQLLRRLIDEINEALPELEEEARESFLEARARIEEILRQRYTNRGGMNHVPYE